MFPPPIYPGGLGVLEQECYLDPMISDKTIGPASQR